MQTQKNFLIAWGVAMTVAAAGVLLAWAVVPKEPPHIPWVRPINPNVASSPAERTSEHLRVLFIGNSFTERNGGQASFLNFLARSAGIKPPPICEQVTIEGASWSDHLKTGRAVERIREGNWDYVVIQEFSTRALDSVDMMMKDGKALDEEIRKVGARTVLFMTWPREWRFWDLAKIRAAYEELGREIDAPVVPVGVAFQNALLHDPTLHLYELDAKHDSPAASYMASCMFYSMFYHTSPMGLPATVTKEDETTGKEITMFSPSDGDAAELQKFALMTVKQYPPLPRIKYLPGESATTQP